MIKRTSHHNDGWSRPRQKKNKITMLLSNQKLAVCCWEASADPHTAYCLLWKLFWEINFMCCEAAARKPSCLNAPPIFLLPSSLQPVWWPESRTITQQRRGASEILLFPPEMLWRDQWSAWCMCTCVWRCKRSFRGQAGQTKPHKQIQCFRLSGYILHSWGVLVEVFFCRLTPSSPNKFSLTNSTILSMY